MVKKLTSVLTRTSVNALVATLCKRIANAGYPATVSINPTRAGIMVAGYNPQKLVLGINYPTSTGLVKLSSPLNTAANTVTLTATVKAGGFKPRYNGKAANATAKQLKGFTPYPGYSIATGHFTLKAITAHTTAILAPLFKAQK